MSAIRVSIADDSESMRMVYKRVLETEDEFEIVGMAADGEQALKQAIDMALDMAILDIVIPIMNGIDVALGITDRHPDTAHPVAGVQIPDWGACLELAARCYELTGLGYLGVDLVMDKHKGPLMLELNARPGLNIQIANDDGLLRRCRIVEDHLDGLDWTMEPVARRLALSKREFAVARLPEAPEAP